MKKALDLRLLRRLRERTVPGCRIEPSLRPFFNLTVGSPFHGQFSAAPSSYRIWTVQSESRRYRPAEKCRFWWRTAPARILAKLETGMERVRCLQGEAGRTTSRAARKRLGKEIHEYLLDGGMDEEKAVKVARLIAGVFGKIRKVTDPDPTFIEQLAFVSPDERAAAVALADRALAGETIEPKADDLLRNIDTAADIGMFGRMLADNPKFNREAAVQVAHAITTHRAVAEDDYYTAVDDLKSRDEAEDAGAGLYRCAGIWGRSLLSLCLRR